MSSLGLLQKAINKSKEVVKDTGKPYVKRSELEQKRFGSEWENISRNLKRKSSDGEPEVNADQNKAEDSHPVTDLTRDEVIKRLRALGQPITLFGESDDARYLRLKQSEQELRVEDESKGGQQSNVLHELKKEEQERKKRPRLDDQQEQKDKSKDLIQATPASGTERAFAIAARTLKDKMEDQNMSIEQKLVKYFKRWLNDWKTDLSFRPENAAESREGKQATQQYMQTNAYFIPLFQHLESQQVFQEIVIGLWEIVRAARERNYLQAQNLYLNLAIGNAPWPIGVTSVGIHERSAREKISHSLNGGAHIMNDEATRKYLQAVKSLLKQLQRLYPTDPSRCMDFGSVGTQQAGAYGGGSEKQALLEAEKQGETWKALGLADAPHHLDQHGRVNVPKKWEHMLSRSEAATENQK